ncbi:MAG: phosphatase PAP2 family protein [Usitatibacter sp.]
MLKLSGGLGWRFDLIVFIALAVMLTALFASAQLDITTASLFYSSDARDHWPLARHLPWSVLYRAAPWITASLVVVGLVALAAGFVRRKSALRRHAVFVLLSVALGPGLIVNAVFKDHWDRPRPRDIVELGGQLHYAAAPLRGEGGKSFPCGHCSVGFLYALGWWIWRHTHPKWAVGSLAGGLFVGAALGLGRMAAGAHFLSDVIWSALLAFGVAHALYHHVLGIPAHERGLAGPAAEPAPESRIFHALSGLAALGGVAVLLALFATPHGSDLQLEIQLASLPRTPEIFEVDARTANVEIVVIDTPAAAVSIAGELHGFGLPTSRLFARAEFAGAPQPKLRYRVVQQGWFTDLDAKLSIQLPAAGFERIAVSLEHGDISVTDATQSHVIDRGKLRLDLRTADGSVRRSLGPPD